MASLRELIRTRSAIVPSENTSNKSAPFEPGRQVYSASKEQFYKLDEDGSFVVKTKRENLNQLEIAALEVDSADIQWDVLIGAHKIMGEDPVILSLEQTYRRLTIAAREGMTPIVRGRDLIGVRFSNYGIALWNVNNGNLGGDQGENNEKANEELERINQEARRLLPASASEGPFSSESDNKYLETINDFAREVLSLEPQKLFGVIPTGARPKDIKFWENLIRGGSNKGVVHIASFFTEDAFVIRLPDIKPQQSEVAQNSTSNLVEGDWKKIEFNPDSAGQPINSQVETYPNPDQDSKEALDARKMFFTPQHPDKN